MGAWVSGKSDGFWADGSRGKKSYQVLRNIPDYRAYIRLHSRSTCTDINMSEQIAVLSFPRHWASLPLYAKIFNGGMHQ